jgi:excisionase family DNA binding protein
MLPKKSPANSSANAASKAVPGTVAGHSPDLVTKAVIAHDCGVTERTVEHWVRERKIPCVRLGHRTVRYRLADVRRALAKRTVKEIS